MTTPDMHPFIPLISNVASTDQRLWIDRATVALTHGSRRTGADDDYATYYTIRAETDFATKASHADVRVIVFGEHEDASPLEDGSIVTLSGWLVENKKFAGKRRSVTLFSTTHHVTVWRDPPLNIPMRGRLHTVVRGVIATRWGGSGMARWAVRVGGFVGDEPYFVLVTYRHSNADLLRDAIDKFPPGSQGLFRGAINSFTCTMTLRSGMILRAIELDVDMVDCDHPPVSQNPPSNRPREIAGPIRTKDAQDSGASSSRAQGGSKKRKGSDDDEPQAKKQKVTTSAVPVRSSQRTVVAGPSGGSPKGKAKMKQEPVETDEDSEGDVSI